MQLILDKEFDFIASEIHNLNLDESEKRELLFVLQLLLRDFGYLEKNAKMSFLMEIYFKTKNFYLSI